MVLIEAEISTEVNETVMTPELTASGKTEVSLRLYCTVKEATLYRLPLVVKLSPRPKPDPNTATSEGELPSEPQELLPVSTVVESGRANCPVLVLLEVSYVMENNAESSALMQVEFPWVTSRVTA